jgi:hypothetical protein
MNHIQRIREIDPGLVSMERAGKEIATSMSNRNNSRQCRTPADRMVREETLGDGDPGSVRVSSLDIHDDHPIYPELQG